MAELNINDGQPEDEKPSGSSLFGVLILVVLAAGAGVAVPIVFPNLMAIETSLEASSRSASNDSSKNQMTFVPFGEVTVNLDEGRMNRYLRLKLSLQVRSADKALVEAQLGTHQLILRNWLLSHLSDKTLEQIRGKAGQNMLRRELRTHFNSVMFSDGRERIYDILFEEFNVQ